MRAGVSLLLAGAGVVVAGCSEPAPNAFQGYAEGEYVYVGSPYAGVLEKLDVTRGQQVASGARLFVIEQREEAAAVAAAEARVRSAEAAIANLSAGRRKPELDALRAQIDSAEAALRLAKAQLDQKERLFASNFISREALDIARANYDRDAAQLAQMRAQLRTGLQSLGRQPEIEAARANYETARAELAQAKARLALKTGTAPAAGLVQDTFYREGEAVAAGSPVVSLLPPGNIKVRFFVPETIVAGLQIDDPVAISCDGCPAPVAARISYISPQAEYTPPVIYSRESRAKLVFLVEAQPAARDAGRLRPGQPVEVRREVP